MDVRGLPALAEDYPAYRELKTQVVQGGVTQVEGMPLPAKAWALAQLQRDTDQPVVVVTYNAEQAARLCADLARYGLAEEDLANLVSSTETLIFAEGAPDLGQTGQRVAALQRLTCGQARVVVGPIGAWLQRTVQPELIANRRVQVSIGETVDIGALEKSLVEFGYERVEAVEQAGQWTRRGGILDVFPGDARLPLRIDFFGDEVESLRPFDVETQRSMGTRESVVIVAVREVPLSKDAAEAAIARLQRELPARAVALRRKNLEDRGEEHAQRLEERIEADIALLRAGVPFEGMEYYLPYLYPDAVCALDFLPERAILVLDEPSQAKSRWEQREAEIAEIAETRAARGEWLTAEMPHACPWETALEAVNRPLVPEAPPAPNNGGAGEEISLLVPPLLGVRGPFSRPIVLLSLLARGLE
nr:hypothetical protein [Armatimonadota bacterium]